jgi:hypothetical protein
MFQIESWKNPYKHKYDSKEYWRERCKFYQYEYLMYFVRTAGISNDKNKLEQFVPNNYYDADHQNKTDDQVVKYFNMLDN